MVPRPCRSTTVVGTGPADQYLATDGAGAGIPGVLYSVNLSWTGAAADEMIHIHDTNTVGGDASAAKIFSFRIQAATGQFAAVLPVGGLQAFKGLWLNVQTGGGKYNITIGWD